MRGETRRARHLPTWERPTRTLVRYIPASLPAAATYRSGITGNVLPNQLLHRSHPGFVQAAGNVSGSGSRMDTTYRPTRRGAGAPPARTPAGHRRRQTSPVASNTQLVSAFARSSSHVDGAWLTIEPMSQ